MLAPLLLAIHALLAPNGAPMSASSLRTPVCAASSAFAAPSIRQRFAQQRAQTYALTLKLKRSFLAASTTSSVTNGRPARLSTPPKPTPSPLYAHQSDKLDAWMAQYQRTRDLASPTRAAAPAGAPPASEDAWMAQYQRTKDLTSPSRSTAARAPIILSAAAATSAPAASASAAAPAPKPVGRVTTPQTVYVLEPDAAPRDNKWSTAVMRDWQQQQTQRPAARPYAAAPAAKSLWQEQGLAGTAAAQRKQQKIDDFMAGFARNRLGGRGDA